MFTVTNMQRKRREGAESAKKDKKIFAFFAPLRSSR